MKTLLLACSGPLNLKVVYCLAHQGATVHIVASQDTNIALKSRHVTSFDICKDIDEEFASDETVRWIQDYCARHAIEVVIPGDIGSAGFLASASQRLRGVAIFPCSSASKLREIHDKWSFASRLMASGIPTPKTVLIESVAEAAAVESELGFPVMVKPLSGESSHGVVRLDSVESLIQYLTSNQAYSHLPLIAQRYILGRDIDISVLAIHGETVISVTQQIQPDGSLEFFEHDGTLDLAKRIIREFDYHGIAHFDMRIASDDSSLMAIECNPRFWYSMPASLWRGVNFVAAGVQYATQGGVSDVPRISPGKYFLPGSLISFLRNPLNVRKLDWQNIRGVLQPALDPVPHLIDLCRKKF